jgi:hypothetical protein
MEEPEKEVNQEEMIRHLQRDLLSERIMRINFQIQLLGLMRDETQKTLQSLQEAAEPETPS